APFLNTALATLMTDEPAIRAATPADVFAIAEIVDQAYRPYIARIGKPPGPMLDDYGARVSDGVVWVLEQSAVIAGIIVLLPAPNYLLLDNIAVAPTPGLASCRRCSSCGSASAFAKAHVSSG